MVDVDTTRFRVGATHGGDSVCAVHEQREDRDVNTSGGGWTCGYCGLFVPFNTTHVCRSEPRNEVAITSPGLQEQLIQANTLIIKKDERILQLEQERDAYYKQWQRSMLEVQRLRAFIGRLILIAKETMLQGQKSVTDAERQKESMDA